MADNPFFPDFDMEDFMSKFSIPGADNDIVKSLIETNQKNLDAIVAANHLVPTLTGTPSRADIDAAGRRIEAERLGEIKRIQALQALPPRVMLNRARWAGALRRLIPLIMQVGPIQSLVLRRGQVFAFGVSDVRLAV